MAVVVRLHIVNLYRRRFAGKEEEDIDVYLELDDFRLTVHHDQEYHNGYQSSHDNQVYDLNEYLNRHPEYRETVRKALIERLGEEWMTASQRRIE